MSSSRSWIAAAKRRLFPKYAGNCRARRFEVSLNTQGRLTEMILQSRRAPSAGLHHLVAADGAPVWVAGDFQAAPGAPIWREGGILD
jgi:hypothetical protein